MAQFMVGRNGNDQLNLFLYGLDALLFIAAMIVRGNVGRGLYLAAFALLAFIYYRMLSRRISRRQEENGKYLRLRYKLSAAWKVRKEKWAQRKDYKFYTCPSCKTTLRVPRGHGKIKIVCRKCGNSFTGKC